jgi:ferric-chelate reductase (NADPH)
MVTTFLNRIAGVATKTWTHQLTVGAVVDIAEGFRRADLQSSDSLGFEPGQKVQVHTRGFGFRTYTPFGWAGERVSLLAALHATGPGTANMSALDPGDALWIRGPSRAVDLSRVTTAPILIGDETSFALGAAWDRYGAVPATSHLYEVTDYRTSAKACEALGLSRPTLVERCDDDAHFDRLCELAVEVVGAAPTRTVVLTGKAQTIRAIRGALKDASLAPSVRVKTHWDPRRSGLD